jgi:PhnB protein
MAGQTKPIPTGFHSITPSLTLNDAAGAIEFYKRAFGAQELSRMSAPQGKIGHAEIKIGDSIMMLSDEMPGGGKSAKAIGGSPVTIYLYVEDVDAVYKKAESAGAKTEMPPTDMFWGDRFAKLTDPYGHSWALATHKEDVAPEEMTKRSKAFMEKMGQQAKSAH